MGYTLVPSLSLSSLKFSLAATQQYIRSHTQSGTSSVITCFRHLPSRPLPLCIFLLTSPCFGLPAEEAFSIAEPEPTIQEDVVERNADGEGFCLCFRRNDAKRKQLSATEKSSPQQTAVTDQQPNADAHPPAVVDLALPAADPCPLSDEGIYRSRQEHPQWLTQATLFASTDDHKQAREGYHTFGAGESPQTC